MSEKRKCGGLIFNRHKWCYFDHDLRMCVKCGRCEQEEMDYYGHMLGLDGGFPDDPPKQKWFEMTIIELQNELSGRQKLDKLRKAETELEKAKMGQSRKQALEYISGT